MFLLTLVVYEKHCDSVKNEASIVKKRLKELSSLMQALEANIESVTKAKEEVYRY